MRWYPSTRCPLLSPLTVPLASPLPRCSPCSAGLPADHQSFTNWLPQTSPASLTLTSQLAPQAPDLHKGGKQLSQGCRLCTCCPPCLACKPLPGRCCFSPPSVPALSQHCCSHSLTCPPTARELLQADAVTTHRSTPRSQARSWRIISAQ